MMRRFTRFGMLVAMAGLAACAAGIAPQEGSSSAQGPQANASAAKSWQGPIYKTSQYDVRAITINVPRTLVVSEANTYRPNADIVWRGEPIGDRYAQVEAILAEAMATGTAMMTSGPLVDVDVTLEKFHCLTERTRYSIGGVHALRFSLTVRDAATGAIIDGPRDVVAETPAAGGAQAIAEDAAGQTERVVVTARLARAIRSELSREVAVPTPDAFAVVNDDAVAPSLN